MKEGWDATGRLEALWDRVGGRDGLAERTGILGTTLSSYNTGKKKLGYENGPKIADALGVTLADLGAPADAQTLHGPLQELATVVDQQGRATAAALDGVVERLARIEELLGTQDDRATSGPR